MGSGPGYEVGGGGMEKGVGIGTRALLTDPPREGGSEGGRDGEENRRPKAAGWGGNGRRWTPPPFPPSIYI